MTARMRVKVKRSILKAAPSANVNRPLNDDRIVTEETVVYASAALMVTLAANLCELISQ